MAHGRAEVQSANSFHSWLFFIRYVNKPRMPTTSCILLTLPQGMHTPCKKETVMKRMPNHERRVPVRASFQTQGTTIKKCNLKPRPGGLSEI